MTPVTRAPGFDALHEAILACSSNESIASDLATRVTQQLDLFTEIFPKFSKEAQLAKVLRRFHNEENLGILRKNKIQMDVNSIHFLYKLDFLLL